MSAGEAEAIARLVWDRGGPGRLPPQAYDPVVRVTWAELIDCVADSLAWNGGDPQKISDTDLETALQRVIAAITAPSVEGYCAIHAEEFAGRLKQEARHG